MRNPLGTLEAVLVSDGAIDTAIDLDNSDLAAYRKSRDLKHLKFIEGKSPVSFYVQPMKAAFLMDNIARCSTDSARWMMAFQVCVHAVKVNGETLTPKRFDKGAYDTKASDATWLDTIRNKFGIKALIEMGQCAIDLGQLSETDEAGFFWPAG